jgi:amino-acid N-acetyltransferase
VTDVSFGPASRDELPQALALFEEGGLPQHGLEDQPLHHLVARQEGLIVKSTKLELYGSAALLRSVFVRRDLRGAGLGRRLIEAALDTISRSRGAETNLLRKTAELFFPASGSTPPRAPRCRGASGAPPSSSPA